MKPTLYQSRAIRCPTHTREPGGLTGCGYDNLYLAEDGAFKCGRCGLRFRPEDAEWSDNGEPVTPAPCSDNQSLHKHDRDCCAYLGRYEGEYLGRVHHDDLYYCNTPTGATVLARHSDEPSDYCSGMNFATGDLIPSLTEARRRAVDEGMCDLRGIPTVPSPKQLPLPQSPCPLPGEEPLHKHDNPDDVFLGCLDKCDLYFHRGPNGTAVISRGGSGAGDYWSGMNMAVQGLEPTLTEALSRAVALGLCDANGIPVSHEFAHEEYPFDVLSANGWHTDYDRVFAGNHHVVCEVKKCT